LNLSLHFAGIDEVQLAPLYDMLPMFYVPRDGRLWDGRWEDGVPASNLLAVWPEAVALAREFWVAVSEDVRVSGDFQRVAHRHLVGSR
jgi:hypothetical protein